MKAARRNDAPESTSRIKRSVEYPNQKITTAIFTMLVFYTGPNCTLQLVKQPKAKAPKVKTAKPATPKLKAPKKAKFKAPKTVKRAPTA